MIPNYVPDNPAEDWRAALRGAFTDPAELLAWLGLDASVPVPRAAARFRCLVTRHFAAKIRRGDAADPLLRQVLPVAAEDDDVPGFTSDPLSERAFAADGLVTKYRGRALVVATGACPIHCRYCFRREFPYEDHAIGGARLTRAVDRIAEDPSLSEVILSGGDPLVLGTDAIGRIVAALSEVPHLKRLRLHTRVPTTLPSRLDDPGLTAQLGAFPGALTVVMHANHPAELCGRTHAAITRMRDAGALVLNQSVLLAGVNDCADTLVDLSEALCDIGVVPYYLHLLDRVSGAAGFDVPEARARALHAEIAARLPGYLVPTLVREDPGAPGKTRLG